ncbi:hypothetical protein D3C72_332750 [compost metagenome]
MRQIWNAPKSLAQLLPSTLASLKWETVLSLLSFPASILLNRILGAEDRGLLALALLIPTTLFALGSCQWDRLLKGMITSKLASPSEIWRHTRYYATWLSLLSIPTGALTCIFWAKLPTPIAVASALYCGIFPIYFLGGSLSAIFVADGKIHSQYRMRTALQGSYLALLVGLWLTQHISVIGIIGVYAVIHIISLAVGWVDLKREAMHDEHTQAPPSKPLLQGFLPNAIETLSSRIDVLGFSLIATTASLGHYTAVSAMMLPIGLVSNSLSSASTARLDWTNPKHIKQYLALTISLLACLFVGSAIFVGFLGPSLLELVLGSSYRDGSWMIPWVALIVASQALAVQTHAGLQLSGFLKEYLLTQSISPFIRCALVIVLGGAFSTPGLLAAIIISNVVKVMICLYYYNQRFIPSHAESLT